MGKKWLIRATCVLAIPITFVLTLIQVYYLMLGLNPQVFPVVLATLITVLMYLPLVAYLIYKDKA